MSKPTRGPWTLRYLLLKNLKPEPGVLSFLTSNGVGKVVTVVPDIQLDNQTWYLASVGEKNEYYHIIQDPASNCPPGLAQVEGSDNVILSSEPGEWRIENLPVDIPDGNVYQIQPPPLPPTGPVSRLLGKEPVGPAAVVESFPKLGPVGIPTPAWQFLGSLPE